MKIKIDKPYQFAVLVLLVAGAVGFSLVNTPEGANTEGIDVMNETEAVEMKEEEFQRAKPLINPTGYINTDNVSIEDNIGEKVILLDMWTYSCINCQRTLPHLKEWNKKYSDDGLLIIGNHAPEFDFEKKRSNVEDAVEKYNLTYPIVLDNNYGTWNAYNNRYWPQKYLIGVDGFIRYEHIGEGRYEQTEEKVRELLKELKMRKGQNPTLTDEIGQSPEEEQLDSTDVNSDMIKTPEIYLGAYRNDYLANGKNGTTGVQKLTVPENLEKNRLYLDGEWIFEEEYAENSGSGEILLRYEAKRVNMVLEGDNTTVTVYQDGELVSESAGRDVENGRVKVGDEQLYNMVANEDYGEHKLRIEVEQGDLKAYTFTFG
jgi:thiol-disulfide isomerase/thioredoxin